MTRHSKLGSGTFGQVFLATSGHRRYALKVQSKFQLLGKEQSEIVVRECNIMEHLKHPFILRLYSKFQGKRCVYMLTSLFQGGELTEIIKGGLAEEDDAKFYAACILEGITYMHQKHIIHRDIKPQNILISEIGYPVIIDFGFAKYVPGKTYTCVGTPLYIAPEIFCAKGYDKGADHWAWACLVYEMVTGRPPFYQSGMKQKDLFKSICRGNFQVYGFMSVEVKLLIVSILVHDASQRLGARPNGWFDIMNSPWFSDTDFKELRRQRIRAPWIPKVKNVSGRLPKESSSDNEKVFANDPALNANGQAKFKTFGPILDDSPLLC